MEGYVMSKKIVAKFVNDIYLSTSDSLESRFNLFEKYVQQLGFDGVAYTFIPSFILDNSIGQAPIILHSGQYPDSLIEQYTNDRLDLSDFAVRQVKENKLSVIDWRSYQNSNKLSSAEKNVVQIVLHEHGIKNNLTIPTMTGAKGVSGVSVVSSANDAEFSLLKKERLESLECITNIFHRSNVDLNEYFVKPYFSNFTPKEIIILKYLSKGLRLKNIAYETTISHSYALNVLSKLRRKLGSITHDKLMYDLGVFKILDDH